MKIYEKKQRHDASQNITEFHPKEDEIDKMTNASICIDCHRPRVLLKLLPHRKNQLRVCVNSKCFKYADLSNLKTWIQ